MNSESWLYKKNSVFYSRHRMQVTLNKLEVQKQRVAQKPRAPKESAWTIVLKAEPARRIVEIYDEWVALVAERLGDKFILPKIDSLRAKISSAENFAYVAALLPPLLRAKVNHSISQTNRNRNDVIRQILSYGLPKITGKLLEQEMPDIKPSVSLVIVSAMNTGYPEFEKDFAVKPLPVSAIPVPKKEDEPTGRPLTPRHDPKYWTVGLNREHAQKTVEQIVALREAWARKVHYTARDRQADRLSSGGRGANKADSGTVWLGVYAPPAVQQQALSLAESRRRPKNFVADWAIVHGIKNLTLKKVMQVCEPDQKPSISQVAGVAMQAGLELFEKQFPAIGGSAN